MDETFSIDIHCSALIAHTQTLLNDYKIMRNGTNSTIAHHTRRKQQRRQKAAQALLYYTRPHNDRLVNVHHPS